MGQKIMYAIAFDMDTNCLQDEYPGKNYSQAYYEVGKIIAEYGFDWKQGSLYISKEGATLLELHQAIEALRKTDWFRKCVRDIRAFRVDDWSDFTSLFKD